MRRNTPKLEGNRSLRLKSTQKEARLAGGRLECGGQTPREEDGGTTDGRNCQEVKAVRRPRDLGS